MTRLLVAVGADGEVWTSLDGIAWTVRSTPTTEFLRDAEWSPELELWVAAGDGAILTSPDGITWTSRSFPSSGALRGVGWSSGLGLWVVTGLGGTLLTSPDGESWTTQTTPTSDTLHDAAWSAGLSLFVAVGAGGILYTSPDGESWTTQTTPTSDTIFGVAWSPDLDMFVTAVSGGRIYTSTNGTTWTSRSTPTTQILRDAAWSPDLSLWTVVGSNGTLLTSPDGVSWTARTAPDSGAMEGVAWSGSLFAAAGATGRLWTSTNGTTWTAQSTPTTTSMQAVADGPFANQPPNAPVLNSPISTTINRQVTNRFDWTFSDDDDGDTQSEFTLQIREQGEATLDVDVTEETPTTHYDLPGGTLAAGDYEWRVRTRDALGEQGPYSSWEPFTAEDPPAGPTITAPGNDETISTENYTVEWSAAEQDDYQLRRVADDAGSPDTGTVYFDTGTVASSSTRSLSVEFPDNDRWEHIQLRVRRSGLWSPWASVRVEVSYTPPATPTAVVVADTPEGAIGVSADHPTPGTGEPDVVSMDVRRRNVGDSGSGIRIAAGVAPSGTHVDWTVASGKPYEFAVRAYGDNGTSVTSAWVS